MLTMQPSGTAPKGDGFFIENLSLGALPPADFSLKYCE